MRLTRFRNGSSANWYCSQDGGACGLRSSCIFQAWAKWRNTIFESHSQSEGPSDDSEHQVGRRERDDDDDDDDDGGDGGGGREAEEPEKEEQIRLRQNELF